VVDDENLTHWAICIRGRWFTRLCQNHLLLKRPPHCCLYKRFF